MKNCRICGILFEPTPYKLRKSDFICATCNREWHRHYRKMRKANGNPVISGKQTPEYHRKYSTEYRATHPEHKAKDAERAAKLRLSAPHKYSARLAVRNALRRGELVKQCCKVCSDPNVAAHHHDYSKPLEVEWLCRLHHSELHRIQRRQAKGE